MSQEIVPQVFKNEEFGTIRAMRGEDGEPWFVAKDVCDALGIRTDTVRTILDDDEVREIPNPNSIGVTHGRAPLIVSEAGLYSLVLKSRKPEAKRFKRWVTHDVLPAIRRDGGSNDFVTYAFAQNQRREVRLDGTDGQTVGAIPATRSGKQFQGVLTPWDVQSKRYVVRRLTPVECERLQGFPDDWTQVPYRGRSSEECPDGPRYKAIGNSMAVPVMRWIGRRIQEVDDACD